MRPYDKAQSGVALVEEAVLEILSEDQELTNSEITKQLGLESDQDGKQKDYLAYSILGRLMKDGRVTKIKGRVDGRTYVGYLKRK